MNKVIISFLVENLIIFLLFFTLSEIEKKIVDYSEWAWVGNIIIFTLLVKKIFFSSIVYYLSRNFIRKQFLFYIFNFFIFFIILYVYDKDFIYKIFSNEGLRINIYILSHFIGTLIMVVWEYGKGRDGRIS